MSTTQIDLENLFSDPKNMPEFIPDYSIDEIDKALNDALAEINQNQKSILGEGNEININSKKRIAEQQLNNDNYKFIKTDNGFEDLTIKPLSPESLHSDTSLVNSPRHEEQKPNTQITLQKQQEEFKLEKEQYETKAQRDQIKIKDLETSLKETQANLKISENKFNSKSQDYEHLIKELHKSEMKRMELMDENNHLKKCVTSLAFK